MRQAKAFLVAIVLGQGVAAPGKAGPEPSPELNAAKNLIDAAKRCSESSAEKFAKVAGETADTIATAAFDNCEELWRTATSNLIRAFQEQLPHFSDDEVKKNPYLLSEHFAAANCIDDQNSLEARREAEIRRLRVLVLEIGSKTASP